MKILRLVPAYLWAIFCVLLIPVTFIGNDGFAKQLAKLPFMKINPIYSGGEIDRVIHDSALVTTIYKPVFEALIGQSSSGFVQVKFEGDSILPSVIDREIDFDNDGSPDFKLAINTLSGSTQFEIFNKDVTGLGVSLQVKDYWIARIEMKNSRKD